MGVGDPDLPIRPIDLHAGITTRTTSGRRQIFRTIIDCKTKLACRGIACVNKLCKMLAERRFRVPSACATAVGLTQVKASSLPQQTQPKR
eukprot:1189878-Prorocentrum_minimum.AAC.2